MSKTSILIRRNPRRTTVAFTLIELVVASALLVVVGLIVLLTLSATTGLDGSIRADAAAQQQAHSVSLNVQRWARNATAPMYCLFYGGQPIATPQTGSKTANCDASSIRTAGPVVQYADARTLAFFSRTDVTKGGGGDVPAVGGGGSGTVLTTLSAPDLVVIHIEDDKTLTVKVYRAGYTGGDVPGPLKATVPDLNLPDANGPWSLPSVATTAWDGPPVATMFLGYVTSGDPSAGTTGTPQFHYLTSDFGTAPTSTKSDLGTISYATLGGSIIGSNGHVLPTLLTIPLRPFGATG